MEVKYLTEHGKQVPDVFTESIRRSRGDTIQIEVKGCFGLDVWYLEYVALEDGLYTTRVEILAPRLTIRIEIGNKRLVFQTHGKIEE